MSDARKLEQAQPPWTWRSAGNLTYQLFCADLSSGEGVEVGIHQRYQCRPNSVQFSNQCVHYQTKNTLLYMNPSSETNVL